MSRCPYCDYVTPEPDDGDAGVRGWQEVAHMGAEHPEVHAQRLREAGVDAGPGFAEREAMRPVVDDPGAVAIRVDLQFTQQAWDGLWRASRARGWTIERFIEFAVDEQIK